MWFNKKKPENSGQLPELPELPSNPPTYDKRQTTVDDFDKITPREDNDKFSMPKEILPALPSFPHSDTGNRVSQEVIKTALEVPSKTQYTREIDSSGYKEDDEERSAYEEDQFEIKPVELPPSPIKKRIEMKMPEKPIEKSNEPVFVRLDKFQTAVKNLKEVKKQISDIEAYLSEIRQIKAKEEVELSAWEKEILEIKARLDSLDKGIFSKVE